MLRNVFQPKTSALANLQEMFEQYPVVTNESLKLKMDHFGDIKTEGDELTDSMNPRQQLFSQLLTGINPFAQFIVREMAEAGDCSSAKNWELDEQILQRYSGEVIKRANLQKTSSEMFSIYMYTKDPSMLIKSDKYTKGEFKAVKDLVKLDQQLLVSSQMENSLLALN